MGLLAAHALVHEPEGVEILMEEDVEGVGLVERRVRLLNPKKGHFVHDDPVARDRVEGPEESLRMLAEVREGEHEAATGPSEHRLDCSFHEFEEGRQVLFLLEYS